MILLHSRALALVTGSLLFAACAGPEEAPSETSLYASVQGIDGVYFFPPLGPEVSPQGTFDATLLDGISVAIEAEDAAGVVTPLATFDQNTSPRVALLTERERYFVNIPAAAYVTDPAKTYRIRVSLDGSELGTSVLSAHIFDVLQWNPALPIGVMVRVEGTGAVRSIPRRALHGGTPAHCSDGRRNKDETGIDCGGSQCAPCPDEICDGVDNNRDGSIDEGNPGGGQPCTTGLPGICSPGTTECSGGHIICVQNAQPRAETCNNLDDNCNGFVDDATGCYIPMTTGWAIASAYPQGLAPTQDAVAAEYCATVLAAGTYRHCGIMEAGVVSYSFGAGGTCGGYSQRIVRLYNTMSTCDAGRTPVPSGGAIFFFQQVTRCRPGTITTSVTPNPCRVTDPSLFR